MKKYILYLMCITLLHLTASCSKDDREPGLVASEVKSTHETGLSFMASSGFEADHVVFKLRYGAGLEKEYGQSLNGYSYTKLQAGAKTIYQVQVFKDGDEVSFNAYTYDAEGNRQDIEATSIVEIAENKVLKVLLEK